MQEIETDLLVIGAGSAGLSVAAGAVQMGARVILLEGHRMGGDCLNYGCVPSKALIASGKVAYAQSHAAHYGVADVTPQVDYAAAKDHVAGVIGQIEPNDSQSRFEGLGVRVIREVGTFLSPRKVQAGDHVITARRVILATGSSPLVPPIPGLDQVPYETNETIFDLREKPGHLLVIGGGPIGMEMAQAHRRLGSEVTVIEGASVLGQDDPEMVQIVKDQLLSEGIALEEGTTAAAIRGTAGAIEVEAGDGRVFTGTHLLIAVGRRANIDRLNLDAAGIETTKRGVRVDAAMRTTNRRVYAIGDVAGGMQFTHVASYHAGLIIRQALLGLPAKQRTDHIPWCTYTQPEIAQVGLTEAAARTEHGGNLDVVRFAYAENDRAIAERKTDGLIKVMVVRGRPVGASIAGEQAGELIGFWAFVLANRLKMKHVAGMVAPYPTLGEINKRVAGAYFSPRLFDSPAVKRVVRFVQRWLP
ncbi:dihydrolipoyl dehydrogenase family protein [Roseovarius tibetensis]|uniref:dihydrolipoyl dehydrogenase family protein n=1 Tax=Roseovarius tibetensis TaxID=2685897 RepID=UPI003D7FADAA